MRGDSTEGGGSNAAEDYGHAAADADGGARQGGCTEGMVTSGNRQFGYEVYTAALEEARAQLSVESAKVVAGSPAPSRRPTSSLSSLLTSSSMSLLLHFPFRCTCCILSLLQLSILFFTPYPICIEFSSQHHPATSSLFISTLLLPVALWPPHIPLPCSFIL